MQNDEVRIDARNLEQSIILPALKHTSVARVSSPLHGVGKFSYKIWNNWGFKSSDAVPTNPKIYD